MTGECVIEPFAPGTFEEYDVLEDGHVKFIRKLRYHEPGKKPVFKPYIPWNGN